MFDSYHKWLGIPPDEQPPNHYRLLGIALFEADPDVIDAAANRQMAFVQSCATGPHTAASQKLLNELAAARVCLLKPEKKSAYDARLRARLLPDRAATYTPIPGPAAARPAGPPADRAFEFGEEPGGKPGRPAAGEAARPKRAGGRPARSSRPPLVIVGAVVAVMLVAGLAVVASGLLRSGSPPPPVGGPVAGPAAGPPKSEARTLNPTEPPGRQTPSTPTPDVPATAPPVSPPTAPAPPPVTPANPVVVVSTTLGSFEVELYPDKAPKTVANFLAYVDDRFYDGTIVHQIAPNGTVQAAGFGPGLRERRPTRLPVPNEAGNGLTNTRGAVFMAVNYWSTPGSGTTHFGITTSTTPLSMPGIPVFGRVTAGMDVVDRIGGVRTARQADAGGKNRFNAPVEEVKIISTRRKTAAGATTPPPPK